MQKFLDIGTSFLLWKHVKDKYEDVTSPGLALDQGDQGTSPGPKLRRGPNFFHPFIQLYIQLTSFSSCVKFPSSKSPIRTSSNWPERSYVSTPHWGGGTPSSPTWRTCHSPMTGQRHESSSTWPPGTHSSEIPYTRNPIPTSTPTRTWDVSGQMKLTEWCRNSWWRLWEPRGRMLTRPQSHQPRVLLAQDVQRRQWLCEKVAAISKTCSSVKQTE